MIDREIFASAYQSGSLLEAIQAALSSDGTERKLLASSLASLHNEGLVDVIETFGALTRKPATGPEFFLLRHVFEEILPELEAPVPKITRCVLHLYREAGTDMVAVSILEAFQDFCAMRADRPHAALAEIEANPEILADLLIPVLVAGSKLDSATYVNETIRLSRDANADLRRRALFALGRLHGGQTTIWANEDVAKTIECAAYTHDDDKVLASAVKSAFELSQHDTGNDSRWIAAIAGALSRGGEIALHAASELFGFKTSKVSPNLLELLLGSLVQVKPSNRGTLENIDYGIANLLKDGQVETSIRFLEDLLRAHPEDIGFSNFDDAVRVIRDNPTLRSKVATRWLIGGEATLCKGLDSVVDAPAGNSPEIVGDAGELAGVEPARFVFAARKAIGYLFLKPTSATSFLLSLMRQTSDARVRMELEGLLLNPLLLNFSGSVAEYASRQVESEEGEVKAAVGRALQSLEAYVEALRSVGDIPALRPSLKHRDAYNRHFLEAMAQSFKKAEEESVILQLVHKTVLLYGRKAIHHAFGPAGEIRRMETQLGTHGTEIEVPRLTIVDPHDLDFMLFFFRQERLST